jgi:putative flippase GtrA
MFPGQSHRVHGPAPLTKDSLNRFAGIADRFARFLLVGGAATALHYAILFVLVEKFGTDPTAATSFAYLGGWTVSYRLNYSFTFRSDRPHSSTFPRFMAVAAAGFCLNAATMYLLNHVLGIHYIVAQVCATGLTTIWHFAANYLWSFAAARAESPSP